MAEHPINQNEIENRVYIGPNKTGDNIDAKRGAMYGWNPGSSQWARIQVDANGVVQTSGTVSNGTNTADVVAGDSGFNGVATAASEKTFQFTTGGATGAQILGPYDCRGYSWLVIHPVTNTTTGMTVVGQFSQTSGGTYSTVNNFISTATAVQPGAIGTNPANYYAVPIMDNYFQINITALTSGTFAGTITLSNRAGAYNGGSVSQVGTWAVGSNSATGSAVPANAFYVGMQGSSSLLQSIRSAGNLGATSVGADFFLGVATYAYNGVNYDSLRSPSIYKSAQATASGNTAVWTPTSGKKFRLMRFKVQVTGNATLGVAGVLTIGLQDSTTDIGITHDVYVPSSSANSLQGYDSGWIDLSNGKLSAASNNVLNVNLSAAVTAGNVRITVCGTEE